MRYAETMRLQIVEASLFDLARRSVKQAGVTPTGSIGGLAKIEYICMLVSDSSLLPVHA
jgi:hypothetical protein